MVPPPWRGARSILCLLNTFVSSLVIWCLTLILVLQPELSEQYKVQIHGTNFTPPSKCWGGQQCPPPARTTLVGGPQSTPPSWDRIRIWQIEAVVVPLHIIYHGSWILPFYFLPFHSNLFASCDLCLFKECPMSSDGVSYVTVITGARMNGAEDLKGRWLF